MPGRALPIRRTYEHALSWDSCWDSTFLLPNVVPVCGVQNALLVESACCA